MHLILPPQRVQWLIRQAPWLCLAGAVVMVLAVRYFRDLGFVSGLMLLMFGGSAMGFRNWLRERGLWMLAAVALAGWLPLYFTMQWDALKRELAGRNPRLVWLGWDTAVAVWIAWLQVRLLATVIRVNRALFVRVRQA
jgi:hypothetical protein